jgi:hypothetical protein
MEIQLPMARKIQVTLQLKRTDIFILPSIFYRPNILLCPLGRDIKIHRWNLRQKQAPGAILLCTESKLLKHLSSSQSEDITLMLLFPCWKRSADAALNLGGDASLWLNIFYL